jgi:hypothetical protein
MLIFYYFTIEASAIVSLYNVLYNLYCIVVSETKNNEIQLHPFIIA